MPEQPIRDLIVDLLTHDSGPHYLPDLLQTAKANFGKSYGKGHDDSYDLPSAKFFREVIDNMVREHIVELKGYKVVLPKEEDETLKPS
jgi:hypothetical protein